MKRPNVKECFTNEMYLAYIRTIILCFVISIFQSCESPETPPIERVRKKISITLEGKTEAVFPWVTVTAYTENQNTLYIIQDDNLMIQKDGGISIEKGEIHPSGKITLYSDIRDKEWIHVGIRFLKLMKNPSETDKLKIRIQAYKNDIQYLDTTRIMSAFRVGEKPSSSEYIYALNI